MIYNEVLVPSFFVLIELVIQDFTQHFFRKYYFPYFLLKFIFFLFDYSADLFRPNEVKLNLQSDPN